MHIVILTPAIPRPLLHNITMKNFYDNIELSDISKYKFTHIINIDSPVKIIEQGLSTESTIDNYKKIIPNYVEQHYINLGDACFSKAYKRLFTEGIKYITDPNCVIIWLEDDWQINTSYKIIDIIEVIKSLKIKYFTIGLKPYGINNAPTIYSYELYNLYSKYLLKYNKLLDPDYILHNFYKYNLNKQIDNSIYTYFSNGNNNYDYQFLDKKTKKYFKNKSIVVCTIDKLKKIYEKHENDDSNYYYFSFKNDCLIGSKYFGRKWLDKRGILKWEKDKVGIKTYK